MTSFCILNEMKRCFRFCHFQQTGYWNNTQKSKISGGKIVRFQNGSNKVAIELCVVQFWSEIILVISNQTRAGRSFNFEITRMISDLINKGQNY